jgi:ABC-type sugar transport system ATPase subunit
MQPVLALRGATKRFPGVVALKGVDVEFFPGRVHALLGENGAGKSTLVRIVSGIHPPDKGETLLDGRPVALSSPRASERAGIAVVHQHRTLVDELSVAENLFLGQLGGDFRGFGLNRFVRRAEPILAELGLDVDPRTLVGSLGPAAQQMVEIGRALSRRPRVLVFDEPTTSLTPPERQVLFDLVRRLRTQGLAIVYISHDLEDTLALSDEVTVLRDGALAAHLVGDVSVAEVVRHMLGREMDAPSPHRRAPGRERVLVAQDLTSKALGGVSVAVHRGEIVCIAGLVGSGRTELLRTLFGLDGYESGRIELNGRTHRPRSPRDSIRRGRGTGDRGPQAAGPRAPARSRRERAPGQ